jgi:hypothetical protein
MSFRRILEDTEKRVPDCFWHVCDKPSDRRLTRVIFWLVSLLHWRDELVTLFG